MSHTIRNLWTGIQALTAWAVSTASLPAQVSQLVSFSISVRYNYTENLDSVPWTARTYDDTGGGWLSGPGVLSNDSSATLGINVGTALPNPAYFSPAGHAVYFRVHFNYPSTAHAILTLTNRIDDGAVFYLNGVLIQRLRVTANPVVWTSGASAGAIGAGTDATVDEVFTCVATNLVAGDNLVAVSVHQSGASSSDVTFGTAISAETLTAITITRQPATQQVQANDSVTFSVGVSGASPQYQWQFNGGSIPSATNADFTISSVQPTHAGSYRVIVSNPLNTVTSQVATLTVTVDDAGPELALVTAQDTASPPYYIVVRFDERVSNVTAAVASNYRIYELGNTNQTLVISNAQAVSTFIRLTVSPWSATNQYVLTVNNVADIHGNTIAPDSRIGIAFWRDLFPLDHAWNWSDAGVDLGTAWRTLGYDETTNGLWALANPGFFPVTKALFYATYDSLPGPKNTSIAYGSPTYYFRTRFNLPPGTGSHGAIQFSHVIDDGAVFYLNGYEVYRYNLPYGPIAFNNLAVTKVSPVAVVDSFEWPVTNLVAGSNVIAVETHVFSLSPSIDSTVVFGTAVRLATAPTLDAGSPPRLFVQRAPPAQVIIQWNATGFVLHSAPAPDGPWSSLPQAASPFTNTTTEPQQFFRLEK